MVARQSRAERRSSNAGTVSDELADGVARLLGDLGLVALLAARPDGEVDEGDALAARSAARTRSSARIVARARARPPGRDRGAGPPGKRIAPTGYRRFGDGWRGCASIGTARERLRGSGLLARGARERIRWLRPAASIAHNASPRTSRRSSSSRATPATTSSCSTPSSRSTSCRSGASIEQAPEAPRLAGGQGGRAARARVQAQHGRHARGVARSCSRRGCRPRARSVRAYDPVAEAEARKLLRGVDFVASRRGAVDGADAVVLVTEWPEFRELDLGGGGRRACAERC